MKKLATDYFGWILLLLFTLTISFFWAWIIRVGFNHESEYLVDLTGTLLIGFGALLLIWNIYELWILVAFLRIEIGRMIKFDHSERKLILETKGQEKSFRFEQIQDVIYSDRRIGTRTPTAHLSYSQINFTSDESLLITSFSCSVDELKRLLEKGKFQKRIVNRSLFEGIRIK